MRVKMFGAIATIATVAALAAVAKADLNAQEPRRARRAGLQSDIGLSDEQVAEIRRIHTESRKASIRRNADLRVARLELEELMGAATVDEDGIAARVKRISELQSVAFKERTESRLAVRRLVTPEQYQKMQQVKRHKLRAHRAHRARPMRRGIGGEGGAGGPGDGEDLAEVDPS